MSSPITVYIKADLNTLVYETDVFLSQVATVWCSDKVIENKCKAVKLLSIHDKEEQRYVYSMMKVIEMVSSIDSRIVVNSIGENDFIINYQIKVPKMNIWECCKTIFISLTTFIGAGFAIMTFNNDASVTDIFSNIYELVMGEAPQGFTPIQLGYSIGLPLGIILFFNHFAKKKITTDPTPIEVQMRLYEKNVNTTVIDNAGREDDSFDIS